MTHIKNQTASTAGKEMKKYLELLKDSPIVEREYYHILLSNLCDVINTISSNAGYTIELINEAIKGDTIKRRTHHIEDIQARFWQIITVSGIIKEKINSDDFVDLDSLFSHYNELSGLDVVAKQQ